MATTKQKRNRLLNEIGAAVAALRNALEIAEDSEFVDLYAATDGLISDLIDLSNQVELIK